MSADLIENGNWTIEEQHPMPTLKQHVSGSVRFQYYRDSNLWYRTDTGLDFPVPVTDVGTATFHASDKALLFMRWIRKHLALIDAKDSFDKFGNDITP